MVRLTVETISDANHYVNPVKQREISLRNLQIPAIENLGVTKDQFDVIDFTDNNIRKIENLPLMKRLESLLLHNNRIQHIQKDVAEKLPNLKTLALTNNNLAELADIEPLSKCPKLEYLSLVGNPCCHKPHYRAYVINKLPSVRVLDYRRIKDVERNAAKTFFKGDEGKKLEEELGKTAPTSNGDSQQAQVPQDRSAEELAIRNAKTLAELEQLNIMLQGGNIPGTEKVPIDASGDDDEFRPEEEEENEPMET